jgi:hypothetical protein
VIFLFFTSGGQLQQLLQSPSNAFKNGHGTAAWAKQHSRKSSRHSRKNLAVSPNDGATRLSAGTELAAYERGQQLRLTGKRVIKVRVNTQQRFGFEIMARLLVHRGQDA